MGGIENAIYQQLKNKRSKRQVLSTGTYIATYTGLHFLNGVAGGAAGRVGADSAARPGGGSGESCQMYPVWLTAGESISVTIAAGGTGDGGSGGNTIFGTYLTLYGAGKTADPALNYVGGGGIDSDGVSRLFYQESFVPAYKKMGARARNQTASASTQADFKAGTSAGTYMFGGAGSVYAAGGNGNDSGVGGNGDLGSGGGSGTTTAGNGGGGYLELIWWE